MRRHRIAVRFAAVAVALATATGCGDGGDPERLTVVATVAPFAWVAREIAPDATVVEPAAGADDPHDAQLSPRQVAAVRDADLVLAVGRIGYQPEIERVVAGSSGRVLEAIELVEPIEDDGAVDPHVWHSPEALVRLAGEAADALAQLDPDRARSYAERARRLGRRLRTMAGVAQMSLDGCQHDVVVVSHPGYAYLLNPRGITQEGVTAVGGHGEPSPRRIAALVDLVRDRDLPAVLAEPDEGRQAAETIARAAGVPVLTVRPLGTAPADATFPAAWEANVDAFARALACPERR